MSTVGLIEDDITMRTLLKTLLEMEDYSVTAFEEHDETALLAALESAPPELIIMDVHLRATNGFDLLSQIRQKQTLKDLLVILSSGMDYSHQSKVAGADGFLMKPYMPDDLLVMARGLLDSRKS